ncbi:LuxR family transcriptional regulator [Kitasatospora gansuensis]
MTLIDREAELAAMDSALAGTAAGQARIVLVEGAVGCGKSELADAVADRAEAAGATVLRALGSAAERDLPLGILRQLTACTPPGVLPELTGEPGNANVGAMQAFSAAAGELAALAPVVIVVDDVHHADDQSCAYLLHLARSTRWARILLVLTESVHERGDDPVFGTELLRRPNFLRIRLERLNAAAVARLVAEQLGPDAAERLAGRFAEATGGNPLLLRAMVEEHRVTGAQEPEVGGAYAQAVLTCLYRCGPTVRELAEVLAVLDDLATAERAARLLDLPLATVNRGVQALSAAGILDGARFRYPAARAAVLEWTDDSARAELHRRAAELAHRSGAAASSVAAQLLAADRTDLPWAVPVLHEAAEQLLADGAAERASACLELADRSGADDEQRAQFRTMLAAIAARSDPGAAERHLTGPLELLRAGSLAPARLAALARLLATQGRIDEAAEVLERITAQDPAAPDGAVRDGAGRDSVNRPGQGGRWADPLDGLSAFPRWTAAPPMEPGAAPRQVRAGSPTTLWTIPEYAVDGSSGAAAELFLRGATLSEATVAPIGQAVRALLLTEGPARAMPWCHLYTEAAIRAGAPGWQAAFTALGAEVLLRQGDLTGAESRAAAAMDLLPERGGSVFAAGVSATLIRACTAMGRHDAAARELARPLPEGLAGSFQGLAHLRARGQYHLATNRFHAALGDFLQIGRTMRRWGLDRPLLLPWRIGAAEALIQLGEAHQAARFVADQLGSKDAAHPWVHGISLRLKAALSEPKERQVLLARAVDELRTVGDTYELVLAMADFGQVLKETGDSNRANMVNRRAWHLADECGAHALRERILPGHTVTPGAPEGGRTDVGYAELDARLSESEKRVAMLAVHGHTNREIAMKLYITISTVEQHLTRVYRKLNITRRQQLPVDLHLLGAAEHA